MVLSLIITSILILIFLIVYVHSSEKKKYNDVVFLDYLQQIKEFNSLICSLNDYVTWLQRDKLKTKYSTVEQYFKNKTKFYKKEEAVKKFNEVINDFDNYIISYNKNYVLRQKEILQEYFNNIEGKKLDEQQRTAIITDEYSNLVIAGAGSGKTLTILGKVKYLIEKKNINPESILLLSFTKKTVEELNERIKEIGLGIEATTFHKLGYDSIKKYIANFPAVANESTLNRVIKEYLQKDIFKDTEAIESYIQYVACYMNIPEEYDNYNSLGEKLDTEKGIDFNV